MNRLLTLAALALLAAPLAADPAPAGLSSLYRAALKQSESLAQRHEDVIQADEHYRQALGAVMPSIYLSDTYMRQDDHAYTSAMDGSNPRDQNLVKLSLAQPLFRGFREYQALDLVQATLAAAKDARRWAAMQIYQDLSQSYFLVLSLERNRALVLDQVKLYDARILELKDFQSIGRSRASDLLTVQAAQALLQAGAVQLGAQIATAREILAFQTGLPADQTLSAEEPMPADAGDLAALLKQVDGRPDLHAAAQRVEAAKQAVAISKGAHWPSADLLGNYYISRPGSSNNIAWDLSIAATLPLFQGFTAVSKTREAESLLAQATLDQQRQQRQAATDVRSAFAALSGDLAQASALQLAYDLSDKSYEALKKDYAHGLNTNLEVLQALSSSRDAQRALEAARFAARNDFERLQAAAGARLNLLGDDHDAR